MHYLSLLLLFMHIQCKRYAALHYASIEGHLNICQLLLVKGAEIDAKDKVNTLLMQSTFKVCVFMITN